MGNWGWVNLLDRQVAVHRQLAMKAEGLGLVLLEEGLLGHLPEVEVVLLGSQTEELLHNLHRRHLVELLQVLRLAMDCVSQVSSV